jgi:hypothetical protein
VVIDKGPAETLSVKELIEEAMANPKKGDCQLMAKPLANTINW